MKIEIDESDLSNIVAGIKAIRTLMSESHGVDGLHLDGDDVIKWDSLERGGRFPEWMIMFNFAEDAIKKIESIETRTT